VCLLIVTVPGLHHLRKLQQIQCLSCLLGIKVNEVENVKEDCMEIKTKNGLLIVMWDVAPLGDTARYLRCLLCDPDSKQLRGLSPRTNYTDPATAACRRGQCQLLRIEGATWLV
jgi:hypothetical protein